MCEMPRTDIYCIMDGTVYGYRKLLPGWHDYVYGMCVSRCIHIATHGGLIVSQRLNGEQIARNKASQVCISFSFTTCCIFFLLLLLLFYLHMTLRVAYSNGSVNSTSYEQHRAWACSIKGWNFSPSPYRRIASAYKWSVFSIPFAVNWVKNSKINATCEEKCKCGILDKQKWNNAFRSGRCGIYHMQCYSHRIRLMDRGLWLYSEYIFLLLK